MVVLFIPVIIAIVRGVLASKTQDPTIYDIIIFNICGAVQSNLFLVFESILAFVKPDGRRSIQKVTKRVSTTLIRQNPTSVQTPPQVTPTQV